MPGRTHRPARAYRRTIRSRDRSARPGFGYPLAFLLASRQALADKNLAEEEVDHQDQHGGGHHGLRGGAAHPLRASRRAKTQFVKSDRLLEKSPLAAFRAQDPPNLAGPQTPTC